MIINHNMQALNAHRQMGANQTNAQKSMEKLSSGLRINRAGDDAAGLAISEKMRGQIRGLDQASRNAQDGISLIQTAEGALSETHSILQRMRELSVQSANDTNTTKDREEIQKEINQLTSEINRIGNTTQFNEKELLNGDLSSEKILSSTDKTVVNSGAATVNSSIGVTNADNVEFKDNTVKFGPSDNIDWSDLDSAQTNTVTIAKDADGNVTVAIEATDSNGDAISITGDKLVADADGNYKYDSHGVSFEISKEEMAKLTAGGSIELDLSARDTAVTGSVDVTGGVGTKSDYAAGSDIQDDIVVSDITVSGNKLPEGIEKMNVAYDQGNGTFTISFLDKEGNAVFGEEVYTPAAGTTTLTYNNHGIEFTIDAGATSTGFELDINLADKLGTTTTTENTTEDKSLSLQIGANKDQSLSVGINDMRADALGLTGTGEGFSTENNVTDGTNNTSVEKALDVTTAANANKAIEVINKAINSVSAERSKLGATQNRLEHTINNLGTSSENLTAAESRIRDVDMAKEMMTMSKENILSQAAQAMLAQANQTPQQVLQLLR